MDEKTPDPSSPDSYKDMEVLPQLETVDTAELVKNEKKEAIPPKDNTASKGEKLPLQRAGQAFSKKLAEQAEGLKIIVGATAGFALVVTFALILSIHQGPPEVLPHGGCSTATPGCSKVCVDTLKKGGNAVDGAIAAMFCIGVVNPHHSGIGGGGFMMIHNHRTLQTTALDFRETAPSSATQKMFVTRPEEAVRGPLSIAVPGEIRGMEEAHKLYGRLPWKDLVMPAVDLARNGFVISKSFVETLRSNVDLKNESPEFVKAFTRNGKIPLEGEIFYRPNLAYVLEIIANEGPDAFYDGIFSPEIVNASDKSISLEDLKNYKAIKRNVLHGNYNGFVVLAPPPPSGGPILLAIMNIMDGYNLSAADQHKPITYHKLIEAFKHVYAMRANLGDPFDSDYTEEIYNVTDHMLSPIMASIIREKINQTYPVSDSDPASYMPQYYMQPDRGTSHVSVIDTDELMVSSTSTINTWFGSHVLTKNGILLNSEMGDFSSPGQPNFFDIPPSKMNFIKPGKRPQSSVSPAIVHSTLAPCDLRIAIGATNGSKIPTGVAEVLINLLSYKMDLVKAITQPRIHNQLFSNMTEYDQFFSRSIVNGLKAMGHNMVKRSTPLNIVQAVIKDNNNITAFSDFRKGNFSAVY